MLEHRGQPQGTKEGQTRGEGSAVVGQQMHEFSVLLANGSEVAGSKPPTLHQPKLLS